MRKASGAASRWRSPARGGRWSIADLQRTGDFFFVRTDVSREPALRACVRAVVRQFGRLDALVNNAGIADPHNGPLEFITAQNFVIDGGMTRNDLRMNGRTGVCILLCAVLPACVPKNSPPNVVCTMEAKACPDGSYVGRDPARNCEFRPCPGR